MRSASAPGSTTSADAPSLDMVYKLVGLGGRDVLKLSPGKETWVGAKQVFRRTDAEGRLAGDTLALEDEPPAGGAVGLLEPVMKGGELVRPHPTLAEMRAHWRGPAPVAAGGCPAAAGRGGVRGGLQ